ncbi:MAG: hypothetical protein EPN41_03240 [Candidimonas sp.]|nr:MAG: hypothetical protein EPN41_03240 [Candidimonas sp.]
MRGDDRARDVVVVTVNNRYARRIIADFARRLDVHRKVAPLPRIVPFGAWLREMGEQACFATGAALPAHRLDDFGASRLWERVIARDESARALFDVHQAARRAADADRLISDGYARVEPGEETDDYRRFSLWRRHYRAALTDLNAEDDTRVFERVCAAADRGELPVVFRTLILAGFTALSPRQESLLSALGHTGVRVCALAGGARRARRIERVAADDPDSEWRLAAQWAASCLSRDPRGRFAIIAPRLEADAAFAHRVLRDALRCAVEPMGTPEPAGSGGQESSGVLRGLDPSVDALRASLLPIMPYDVSIARPLGEWTTVRGAFAWLRALCAFAAHGSCSADIVGTALLAGCCVGASEESSGRAAVDVAWRRLGAAGVTADDLSRRLVQSAPRLAAFWVEWQARREDTRGEALLSEWIERFRHWLEWLGFPGDAPLDSQGYQVMEAFEAALTGLARQDPVLGRLDIDGALRSLERFLGETLFQPRRDASSRLEVLGFLESEGGHWDGVWVLGLTDDVLPAVPDPNPFLPLAALRRAGAPRATPERELAWAEAMAESFVASAPDVWLSHARRDGEQELRPSPLLWAAGAEPASGAVVAGDAPPTGVVRRARRGCMLERVIDNDGPPLAPGDETRGGIGVIDTQARDPLWAFVKYRLGASCLPPYAVESGRNVRGIFLHRAVELVWRLLGDQANLLRARDGGTLGGLVTQAVDRAGDECLSDGSPVLRQLEVERARGVLDAWLALECERSPFAIAALERHGVWSFGPLTLSLRIDRIDRLADGRLAIIDYKSGLGRLDPKSDWMRERPVGLQLPCYASVLAGESSPVAAMVLARLHARKVETVGLADGDRGLPGLAHPEDWPLYAGWSWERIMDGWRGTIEGLAKEYIAGRAVNEVRKPADLDYCDVRPFLRLNQE